MTGHQQSLNVSNLIFRLIDRVRHVQGSRPQDGDDRFEGAAEARGEIGGLGGGKLNRCSNKI